MKILYDYQAFNHQKFGGVSRYFDEMIMHLPSSVEKEIAIWRSDNIYLKQRCPGLKPERWHYDKHLNRRRAAVMVAKGDFDLFHPTYFDPYFLKCIGDKPFVLTIHDMIDEIYHAGKTIPERKALLASKAAHIIAVSECTKRDVMRLLGIPAERISVVYHASSLQTTLPKNMPELPERYLLYVGNRARKYKNFAFFIEAMTPLMRQYADLHLVCVGAPFTSEEEKALYETGFAARVQCMTATEDQLYSVYHRALCFVFPSEYEGFGIPILEAFQAACPVVLSKSSCFPEIAGDAALYFESAQAESMRQAVVSMLEQPDDRHRLIQKGEARLKMFSWEHSAAQTAAIYQQVLENDGKTV